VTALVVASRTLRTWLISILFVAASKITVQAWYLHIILLFASKSKNSKKNLSYTSTLILPLVQCLFVRIIPFAIWRENLNTHLYKERLLNNTHTKVHFVRVKGSFFFDKADSRIDRVGWFMVGFLFLFWEESLLNVNNTGVRSRSFCFIVGFLFC